MKKETIQVPMSTARKVLLAKKMLTGGGDLGGKSVEKALNAIEYKQDVEHDPITTIIVNAAKNNDDVDDMTNDLDYAIRQLQKAREAIEDYRHNNIPLDCGLPVEVDADDHEALGRLLQSRPIK